ncbi:hypothetical protein, unknown function [Leishmania tarentolae]|uniref:Uncharacterized protein n=1 Tax=Leishmania tarentolae TaxID=5689 RepID=A0A640KKR8_LEITA|nr:hypothetical protein, unknown function [Leishmania tarentolae]
MLSGPARPSYAKRNAAYGIMTSRVRLLFPVCIGVIILITLVCTQTIAAQGNETYPAAAQQETTESEKNQHVLRLVLILLPVMFVLWFILCFILAYIYVCVCPNYFTK